MRRLLPGILVAVLGVGVVAGAALGESQRPVSASGTGSFSGRAADDWVDHVVATTTAAGSARFTDASTTESPDPAYRSTSHGSGVVDFTSGDFQVTEVNHEVTSEAARGQPAREVPQTLTDESIGIGRSLYLDFSLPVFNWVKFPEARYPHVALGLDQPAGAQVALGGLTGIAPVVSVRDLGPAMVRGVSTTRYRVINQSYRYCPAHGTKFSLSLVAPTTLWVDDQGRIVQAASSQQFSSGVIARIDSVTGKPAPPPFPSTTTAAVLRFSDFGTPVHIHAPVLGPNQPKGFGIAVSETPPKKGLCRS